MGVLAVIAGVLMAVGPPLAYADQVPLLSLPPLPAAASRSAALDAQALTHLLRLWDSSSPYVGNTTRAGSAST